MHPMSSIDAFITLLSKLPETEEATNLYRGNSRAAQVRRHNLRLYLTQMQAHGPRSLLLGEAPGHRGCGLTGIPFTSERVMGADPFFEGVPYQCINAPGQLETEQSATIVWEVLSALPEKPLLWNIFPFHPHQAGDRRSNRTPSRAELEQGKDWLLALLALYDIRQILALGKQPAAALSALGLPHVYVRHPARAGKHDCQAGLWQHLQGGAC